MFSDLVVFNCAPEEQELFYTVRLAYLRNMYPVTRVILISMDKTCLTDFLTKGCCDLYESFELASKEIIDFLWGKVLSEFTPI